jgi:rRNA-processing protein FCF1
MNGAKPSGPTFLDVTRTADGRYCVDFTRNGVSRRSYTPSIEQVIGQAQRAGNLAVRTDDLALRQRCQEAGVALMELSAKEG